MTTFRVAHVHPSLGFGGTQKSIEAMVRYATDHFESHILCLNDLGVRGESLRDDGYRAEVVDDINGVRDYIREHDIDVVHVHGGFDRGTEVIDIARKEGIPATLKSLHFGKPDDGNLEAHVDRYLYVGKMIFLRHLLLSNRSLLPVNWQDNHRLLYNPLDLHQIDPDGPGKYRKKFDIPDNAPVVGKIGRSAPEKWGSIMIDSLNKVVDERPDTHILLVNTPEKIQKQLKSLGLDNVHHIDGVPLGDIDMFYNSIDVLTHSSAIGECCPYVFLEAMASGTPIVVDSQPMRDNGQIELLDHGTHGYIANTPPAYANATLELLNDPDLRKSMGEAGQERVDTTFAAEKIADRLESLYATVLVENEAIDDDELAWWDGPPEVTDMPAFAEDYACRLNMYYDGLGIRHEAERYVWNLVTSLPVGRKAAYEGFRKGFLFAERYL